MEQPHPYRPKRWQIQHNERKIPLAEALRFKLNEWKIAAITLLGFLGLKRNSHTTEVTGGKDPHNGLSQERFRPISYKHPREHRIRRPRNHH